MKYSDHNPSYSRSLLIAIAGLLVAGLACGLGPTATPAALTAGGPAVTLTSPVQGQKLPADQAVAVNSTSVDTDGVQRVELWVDGAAVRVDSNPAPSSPYIVSQTWPGGAAGTHVVQVKAYDPTGAVGQSQPVTVVLETAAQPSLPEFTPTAAPSPTPGPTSLQPTWTPTI